MYQLVIVDDEQIIRNGLQMGIAWNDLGFEVAATAQDGAEALALLQTMPVDVLLMDIQMPELTGLELIRLLRERESAIKVIIISGFSNFEYARESIQLRVEDYLLKPIDPKLVVSTFTALKERMDKERTQANLLQQAGSGKPYPHIDPRRYSELLISELEQAQVEKAVEDAQSFAASLKPLEASDAAACCKQVLQAVQAHFGIQTQVDTVQLTDEQLCTAFLTQIQSFIKIIQNNADQMSILLCKRAKAIVDARYMENAFSLCQMASDLGISYGYLSAVFSRYYKMGPKTYLVRRRMEKGRILLLERKLKMYEISEAVGYTSPRYFSDAFRKHYGVSPSQYLSGIRSKEEKE